VRVRQGDAATYRFPKGDLIVYLFNPFDGSLIASVIERLARSAEARDIALVYHTPVERDVIEAHPAFELVGENKNGVVYVVKPPSYRRR